MPIQPQIIETYLNRNLSRTLVASGFDMIKSDPCDNLVEDLQSLTKHMSVQFAAGIEKRIAAPENTLSQNDLVSWVISDASTIQAVTINLFAAEIERGEKVLRTSNSKLTCQQARKYVVHLGALFNKAVEDWIGPTRPDGPSTPQPRSKRIRRKQYKRAWHPRMINIKK